MTKLPRTLLRAVLVTALVLLFPAAAAAAVKPANVAPPSVSDTTPHDGDRLTAYAGTWTGTAPISYAFQWQRCPASGGSCASIPGATAATYTVQAADVGSVLRARVTAANLAGSTVATAATGTVAPSLPRAVTPPAVSGTAVEGRTLSTTTGSWTGTAPIAYAYRWKRCDAAGGSCGTITGAQSATYTLTSADAGKTVRATVIAQNAAGQATATSTQTAVVAALPPVVVAPPTIGGIAEEGLPLLGGAGTWSVSQPTTYAYQWLRCDAAGGACAAIAGETGPNLLVSAADVGASVRLRVTATNPAGSTTATSAPTDAIAAAGPVLLSDGFAQLDGLLTNGWAFANPTSPAAVVSPRWQLTSGSLFARSGRAWTGVPDGAYPNATSSNGTGSAIFRMVSRRSDLGNVTVSLSLLLRGLVSTSRTPATAWDGAHVWLRYESEEQLYALTVARRDGTVLIKKKCPGGTSNGGTYYSLTPAVPAPLPAGSWRTVTASARTNADGSVSLALSSQGKVLVQVTDRGTGCAPLTAPGAVGIRGDNAELELDDVVVRGL